LFICSTVAVAAARVVHPGGVAGGRAATGGGAAGAALSGDGWSGCGCDDDG